MRIRRKELIDWVKALSYPADKSIAWINTADQKPEIGQVIAKYWSVSGNLWTGKHTVDIQHESFDKWLPCPLTEKKETE